MRHKTIIIPAIELTMYWLADTASAHAHWHAHSFNPFPLPAPQLSRWAGRYINFFIETQRRWPTPAERWLINSDVITPLAPTTHKSMTDFFCILRNTIWLIWSFFQEILDYWRLNSYHILTTFTAKTQNAIRTNRLWMMSLMAIYETPFISSLFSFQFHL